MVIESRLKNIFLGAEMELLRDFGNDQSEEETMIFYENESAT